MHCSVSFTHTQTRPSAPPLNLLALLHSHCHSQAEAMLGISAAKLAEIKEGDGGDDKLAATVKGAQYSEWVLTIASRTQV